MRLWSFCLSRETPTGAHWYLLVPTGAYWYVLGPTGTYWCLLVPTGAYWYLLVLKSRTVESPRGDDPFFRNHLVHFFAVMHAASRVFFFFHEQNLRIFATVSIISVCVCFLTGTSYRVSICFVFFVVFEFQRGFYRTVCASGRPPFSTASAVFFILFSVIVPCAIA